MNANPLPSLAMAEMAAAVAAGRADATLLVAAIRAGEMTPEKLAYQLQRLALNAFEISSLVGLAAVLIDELSKGTQS